jgi:hypothetical protein
MFRRHILKSVCILLFLKPGLVHAEDHPNPASTPIATTTTEMPPQVELLSVLKVFGDVRQRYEYVYNEQPAVGKESTYSDLRLRGRFGVKAQPTNDVAIEIRLATAAGGTSTNQTYGDGTMGMRDYEIRLDRASGKWSPCSYANVTAGKMANPFTMAGDNDLVYDTDLNFDGTNLGLQQKFGDFFVFANAGQFILAESKDAAPSTDLRMTLVQLGTKWTGLKDFSASLIGSHYSIPEAAGHTSLLTNGDFAGNSNAASAYSYDFSVDSAGLELTYNWFVPVGFYYEMDWNSSVDNENHASIIGLKFNKLKDKGDWISTIDFRHIERDSLLGILTDSDSFGGGANGESIRIMEAYAISKALNFSVAYFHGKKNIAPGQTAVSRDRGFVDVNFSF